ncbi:hypothetical protein ABL78_7123 [Leptomonas seymouri]|uniref:Flagellar attachment zone protein 1 conserved domain-containing protein n=1 Tax=Leptomonas seymouri TaxID=5684 RepID=A0A0N1HSU5_LEPSE|nr:hypothetical protein ABL78_7123 [Leptomonas seymouri]|eukprot:KPI83838.1 hypothetical protein ABL78_7123 [Leptomonas seymouri]
MESRKLKRYDSAPISTGASSSATAAAAVRTAAHVSHIPRQHGNPPLTSSSKPTINSSSSSTAAATQSASRAAEPYEKQLEAYYRCMEEDNQALARFYETHMADIASLKVLAQERKYKETVMKSMEAKVAAMDAFLQEMVDLTAPSRGLRLRNDANVRDTASGALLKSSNSNLKSSTPSAGQPASMDSVRDAVQTMQASLQAACASEEKHIATIQALEKEVAEWKAKAQSRHTRTASGATDGGSSEDTVFLPGTAKELREAQHRVRDLERRLTKATLEAKNAAAALAQLEQRQQVTTQTLQRREDELAAMRRLLNSKEQLLVALEEEAKTTRTSTATTAAAVFTPRADGAAGYARTNSAPAGAAVPHHRLGGETCSDRLVVTRHYRLLGGRRFVDAQEFSAAAFRDAFMRSVSTLLRIPHAYLTSVEVRTHAEAVSVELDIRHSARVGEDEIDFMLLSHDYPELMVYLEKVKTELAAKMPLDRNAARVKELQATLFDKDRELDYLRRKLRALEESVERRDNDRDILDKDVDAALQETECTVKVLYEALQTAQKETEAAQKALSVKASQVRVLEQAKATMVDASATAERNYEQEIEKLNEQLAETRADLNKARDALTQVTQQARAEEKMDMHLAVFTFDIPLSTSSAQRMAASILQDAQQTRVLHALVLAYAGRTGGAIPVQVKSCAVPSGSSNASSSHTSSLPSSSSVLQVAVELAYYANRRTSDTMRGEIDCKLKGGGSCTPVNEYLRLQGEAARKEAAAAADAQRAVSDAEQRASAATAAMRAEKQHAHDAKSGAAAVQLADIATRVASIFPDPPSAGAGSPSKTNSVVSRVEQLIIRVVTAEAAASRFKEESQRAAHRLTDVQQEREQLQQTLSELTARCTEVRVAKEHLASRLATAEDELRTAQMGAAESESALVEKSKRLELALRAKTAAAQAEKEKSAQELKNALAASADRLAETEEALAVKDKELKRLQARLASTASSSSTAAAKSSVNEEAALREALKIAKEDRTALARQVKEMETDMNDLSNIQAAMQRELESTQQELRAKGHDFDLLVKQLIRMEEKEKKWQADQHLQAVSPDSPSRLQSDEAEKDDVARESLVVLTNSNTNLQQCLRKLQRTMKTMGLEVNGTSSNNSAKVQKGIAKPAASAMDDSNENGRGVRRSDHRKGALSATVSRAAMDHQQLSAQLSDLLLRMLEALDTDLNSGNSHADVGRAAGSGAAFTRTASCHSNPADCSRHRSAQPCIVKQRLSNLSFARTQSTPALVERSSLGTRDDDTAAATQRSTPKAESSAPGNDNATAAAGYSSPTVTGSGGKATVDAAPRLEFHRQTSAHTYIRSNTATAALNNRSGSGSGGGLPRTCGGATNAGSAGAEKERQSRELPPRRTGSGAAGTSTTAVTTSNKNSSSSRLPSSGSGRHNPPSTATATPTVKSNPFRHSNAAAASSSSSAAGSATLTQGTNGCRQIPTSTTETGGASSSSQTNKRYRMRF